METVIGIGRVITGFDSAVNPGVKNARELPL
jgi:hypothetical protein